MAAKNKLAIVTGAAQGIGKTIALSLYASGYRVAALDLNEQAIQEYIAEQNLDPESFQGYRVDISQKSGVEQVFDDIESRFGTAGILINAAAIFSTLERRSFLDITENEWRQVLDVNVNGTFYMSQRAAKSMVAQQWGRIVHISSNTVGLGRPLFLHYVTSKSALVGMTRSMARELGGAGVTVNAIMPSLTKTGVATNVVTEETFQAIAAMQCIPRAGKPRDIANAIRFLASDDAEFITGQCLAVDGGATFS
ncbi:MAG: SDR family oxidoreductase [Pigmentiphaga sp.]|nr:SDR family oxidoreductase [Pigmentiphaga sp.]